MPPVMVTPPALVNLATTSSMEKQRLAHVSIGHVTMRNLPMVQTILTGIAIGIFPLLVLAAVFNKLTLSVLKGYVFALMWLQTAVVVCHSEQCHDILCEDEWCAGRAV